MLEKTRFNVMKKQSVSWFVDLTICSRHKQASFSFYVHIEQYLDGAFDMADNLSNI